MLIGLLWAALAPLLLLLPRVWLARKTPPACAVGMRAWGLPVLLVAAPVAALWVGDWREFVTVCETEGAARIKGGRAGNWPTSGPRRLDSPR